MSSITEYIQNQVEKQEGKELSIALKKWETEGEQLFGVLQEISTHTGDEYDSECQKYKFETDEGYVSTILGTVGDRCMNYPENIGMGFCITFKGKKRGKNGRSFNDFSIVMVPMAKRK